MIDQVQQETYIRKITASDWWSLAKETPDSHYAAKSGITLAHHLEAVHQHVQVLFQQADHPFWLALMALLPRLRVKRDDVFFELSLVALLHDIGKTKEDKSLVIPHPLTGKPAHMRHGIVGLMATMEILGKELEAYPERRQRIYRTVELHDMSYGLYRNFQSTGEMPTAAKWTYIDQKVHALSGAGLMYLLLFKLADIHGHSQVQDVVWFYETVHEQYFKPKGLSLPIPNETIIKDVSRFL